MEIAAYLNSNFTDTYSAAVIPNSLLVRATPGHQSEYTISLQLTNFLSQSARGSLVVSLSDGTGVSLPYVMLMVPGGKLYRSSKITLLAGVSYPSCLSGAADITFTYEWKLYAGLQIVSLVSASLDPRSFIISPNQLQASTTYTVVVVVTIPTGESVTTSSFFATGSRGVVASMKSGSAKTVSTSAPIILDASSSSDLDYPDAVLSYAWSCIEYSPNYGASCSNFQSANEAILTVGGAEGTLDPAVYTIAVTVSNTAAGKTDSTSMLLTVVENRLPDVVIAQVAAKYNADSKVVFTGSVTSSVSAVDTVWLCPSVPDFAGSGMSLTPLESTVDALQSAQFQLAVAANSLTAGLSYVFQLSAAYSTSSSVGALLSVNIVMNVPPRGGEIIVTPTTGSALVTRFLLSAIKWIDDLSDYPLSYELAYYQLNPTELNFVKNLDLASYATVSLGQGLSSNDYRLHCVANVYDIYNGKGSDSTTITVYGPPPSRRLGHATSEESARGLSSSGVGTLGPSTLEASISLMNGALSKFNPALLFATVSNILSTINSVDCSSAPSDCGSGRNREVCRRTANTCGACLTGYVGVPGDANSACGLMGDVRKDGESCSGDRDCMSGSCESGSCIDQPKSCLLYTSDAADE